MDLAIPAHVLVVANRTAATPALLDAVRQRADVGPSYFHLLVPKAPGAEAVVARAVPLIEEAAHRPVTGSVSQWADPMDAIEQALHDGDFDEIILSTLAPRVSRWLRLDLTRRVAHLGLPLTTVVGEERDRAGPRRTRALRPPRAPAASPRSRRGA
jgi:hypothetical protein